jgi:uncharacterized membrane protein
MELDKSIIALKIIGWLEICIAVLTLILGYVASNISIPAINESAKVSFAMFLFFAFFLLVIGIITLILSKSFDKIKK